MRSSLNGRVGDAGPDVSESEAFREGAAEAEGDRVSYADRFGEDGFRGGGCCLIRRRPVSRSG